MSRGRAPTVVLRHGQDSYGRQQKGIMNYLVASSNYSF